MEREHLARGQPRLIAKELRQIADPAERSLRSECGPGEGAATAGRPRETEKYFHGGRLSRAVRSEETEHALLHGEREVIERNDLCVALRDVLEADRPVRDRHYRMEFAIERAWLSVKEPITSNIMPSFCQMTALAMPVLSPT